MPCMPIANHFFISVPYLMLAYLNVDIVQLYIEKCLSLLPTAEPKSLYIPIDGIVAMTSLCLYYALEVIKIVDN